jgi:hypothetical protein
VLCENLTNTAKQLTADGLIEADQLQSVTLFKILGLTFDGDKNIQQKSFYVGDIQRIVFDEIFLCNTYQLSRIKDFINTHPNTSFGATGDAYQNNPIEELTIKNKKQYYTKIVHSIFPNVVILHENKRCKSDEDRAQIKLMTTEVRTASSMKQAIEIVKRFNINMVKRKECITTNRNVCAFNNSCLQVNDLVYKRLHPTSKYFVGQRIICRKNLKGKGFKTHINYTYTIKNISDVDMELSDGEVDFKIPIATIQNSFTLPYAQTCHSMQGMSVDEPITIFDVDSYFVDVCWFYTAITRVTSLANLNIYVGEMQSSKRDIKCVITSMIASHRVTDINADREVEAFLDSYVDLEWTLKSLKKTKVCKYCDNILDTEGDRCFSIDRIDNNLAHLKHNCQIICVTCNKAKK